MLDTQNRAVNFQTEARAALDDLGNYYGVDLLSILDKGDEDVASMMRATLYPPMIDHLESAEPGEDPEAHAAVIAALKAAHKSSVAIFPNQSWEQSQVATLQSKTGTDVAEFVSGIVSLLRLTQSEGASAASIAATIVTTGLVGLGPVAYYAAKSGAGSLTASITAGIAKLGVAGWAGLAGTIILELATFLLTKQASFVGLVVNNTDEEFTVKDWRDGVDDKNHHGLYLNHGKVSGFMVADLRNLHSDDEEQIAAPGVINGIPYVYMGIFYAEKRKAALFGTEGAMIFKPKHDSTAPQLALAWSCPYSGSNGAAVDLTSGGHSAEHYWKKLHGNLSLQSTDSSGSYSVVANVNSASGPDASCIVVLNKAD